VFDTSTLLISAQARIGNGHIKSCLSQQEDYLLHVSRYIELNPVRAGMADKPARYSCSSYQINALGKNSDLWTSPPLLVALHKDASQRQAAYRALFAHNLDGKLLEETGRLQLKGWQSALTGSHIF
jgi:putative transposase